jgi:hypothetical protein
MQDTFALLVVAHLLSDFLFQTDWIAENKKRRHILLLHIAIVAVTTGILLGDATSPLLWIIVLTHFLIDFGKTFCESRLWNLLLDQAIHLGVLAGGTFIYPNTANNGFWFQLLDHSGEALLMKTVVIIGGIVLCLNAGGIIIAQTMKPLLSKEELKELVEGIPKGGKIIGLLERSLVMLFIWINQPAGIGFLVTAKSILRFGDIKEGHQRKLTEYIIIGTFLSFGWALLISALLQQTLTLW